jgi:hypothetical protein
MKRRVMMKFLSAVNQKLEVQLEGSYDELCRVVRRIEMCFW